ncbi:hypothetical protein DSO57_1037549 [Entomophthora muscae]|uniref:Uncharacterized protein n=1 Tax=Entomophthora muscae TaxID=34485 RepID=A0ACC2RPX0_9FUNG|nr:hypothetical protein DSO57_1037549 [Entomophthora muscae]
MELSVTPKPMPASLPNLPTDYTGKLFGIVYITLTGVIDTIILAVVLGGEVLLLPFKLAPLFWWALSAKNLAQMIPETNRPAAQDWIPDRSSPLTDPKPIKDYWFHPRTSNPTTDYRRTKMAPIPKT